MYYVYKYLLRLGIEFHSKVYIRFSNHLTTRSSKYTSKYLIGPAPNNEKLSANRSLKNRFTKNLNEKWVESCRFQRPQALHNWNSKVKNIVLKRTVYGKAIKGSIALEQRGINVNWKTWNVIKEWDEHHLICSDILGKYTWDFFRTSTLCLAGTNSGTKYKNKNEIL